MIKGGELELNIHLSDRFKARQKSEREQ